MTSLEKYYIESTPIYQLGKEAHESGHHLTRGLTVVETLPDGSIMYQAEGGVFLFSVNSQGGQRLMRLDIAE